MAGTSEFGERSLTLTDCLVATFSPTTTFASAFGTPASLAIGQTMEIDFEADTDELVGYGYTQALLTVIRGGKLKISQGGVDRSVLAILAGISNSTSGSGAAQVAKSVFAASGTSLPYWGAIGLAATDDGGYAAFGICGCMLDKFPAFTLDGKDNKFNMSETEGRFMPITISSVSTVLVIKTIQDRTTWNAPATGGAFATFFSG